MAIKPPTKDTLPFYIEEMGKRVVSKSGIPSDMYHIGKLVLQGLKDDPDLILQIDGATAKSETSASVLERSIRCAIAFQNLGLKHGDVIVLSAPNHLDVAIPFYAALYLGIIVAAVDRTLGIREIEDALRIIRPKIVLCQYDKSAYIQKGIVNLHLDCKVVTFDKEGQNTFTDLLEKHKDADLDNFIPSDFDTAESIAILTSTSGTTGLPKLAALTHKNLFIGNTMFWTSNSGSRTSVILLLSPLQWLSAGQAFVLSPILRCTCLQTSLPPTPKHVVELINTYKPSTYNTIITPTFMTTMIPYCRCGNCDLSCFEVIVVGGSVTHKELKEEMKVSPLEIEMVIHEHPGVLDVVVTGIPDRECGNLIIACVVRRPGSHVTAQGIKDLVKDTLSDSKQLRGGVIFMDQLPVTAAGKTDRTTIKALVNVLKQQ